MNRKERRAAAKRGRDSPSREPGPRAAQAVVADAAAAQAKQAAVAEAAAAQAKQAAAAQAAAESGLGKRLAQRGDFSGALAAMDRALCAEPGSPQLHMLRARALNSLWRFDEALESFRQALRLAGETSRDPELVNARLGMAIAELRFAYRDEEDIAARRLAFERELDDASRHYEAATAQELAKAAQALTAQPPFLLPFQGQSDGQSDVALMRKYGALVTRLLSAALPRWTAPREMPARAPGGRIRVGFASAFFRHHSVWKVPLSGWLSQLDRTKFQVFGYHLGSASDAVTKEAAALCDRWVAGPMSLPAWAERIGGEDLHALVYPEIGMDRVTYELAALRLAPVQCNGLGHPSTSGLPAIDFALSGERLDSYESQAGYAERLVVLPNFGAYYEPRAIPPAAGMDREAFASQFSLKAGGILYWVSHQVATLHPRFDEVFARIAERVPESQMVFIQARSEAAHATLLERMTRAFAARGLSFSERCVFLPVLQPPQFAAATRVVDVGLDTIGWSGCNTTLETLAQDVPVVTLPGDFTRTRHAFAFLSMMGVTETIAQSPDDFIEIAVRLGRDMAWRRKISEKIAATKARCYRDRDCIAALEAFFERCVTSRSSCPQT